MASGMLAQRRFRMARLPAAVAPLLVAAVVAGCGQGGASPADTPTPQPTAALLPASAALPPEDRQAREIDLPDGFTAYVIAEGFQQPTSVALGPDGSLYVSQRGGPVFRLEDGNGDGFFEKAVPYTSGISGVHGFTFGPGGALYVSNVGRVTVARDTDGDTVTDQAADVIQGLPHGRHENNGIVFGPDGKLYITNGSTMNDGEGVEADERSATILQANPDGSGLRVYARGLRNPYDLTFDPQGRLWATDNGSDPPCNTIDELNLVIDGGDYGWPYGPTCDSFNQPSMNGSGLGAGSAPTPPVGDLGFNTASTGIAYYGAPQFPADFRGSFFITLWGSNDAAPVPGGRVLVRAVIDETPQGPRATVEEFGTGFFRPVDVVVDTDGTLLVLDFGSGLLYRIIYTGA